MAETLEAMSVEEALDHAEKTEHGEGSKESSRADNSSSTISHHAIARSFGGRTRRVLLFAVPICLVGAAVTVGMAMSQRSKLQKETTNAVQTRLAGKKAREGETSHPGDTPDAELAGGDDAEVIIVLTDVCDTKNNVVGSYVTRKRNANDDDSEDFQAVKLWLLNSNHSQTENRDDNHRFFFKSPGLAAAQECEGQLQGRFQAKQCVFEVCQPKSEHWGEDLEPPHLSLMLPSSRFFKVTLDKIPAHDRVVPKNTWPRQVHSFDFWSAIPNLSKVYAYDFVRMDAYQLEMVTGRALGLGVAEQNSLSMELLVDRLVSFGAEEQFALGGTHLKTPLLFRNLEFAPLEDITKTWKYTGHLYLETMESAFQVYAFVFQVIRSASLNGVTTFLDLQLETALTAAELHGHSPPNEGSHVHDIGTRFFLISMLIMEKINKKEIWVDQWRTEFIERMREIYTPAELTGASFNLKDGLAKTKLKIVFLGEERTINANTGSFLEAWNGYCATRKSELHAAHAAQQQGPIVCNASKTVASV